jgi:hypothetical protein
MLARVIEAVVESGGACCVVAVHVGRGFFFCRLDDFGRPGDDHFTPDLHHQDNQEPHHLIILFPADPVDRIALPNSLVISTRKRGSFWDKLALSLPESGVEAIDDSLLGPNASPSVWPLSPEMCSIEIYCQHQNFLAPPVCLAIQTRFDCR